MPNGGTWDRNPHFNQNTLAGAGAHRDIAPGAAGASAYPDHTERVWPRGLPGFGGGSGGEAAVVVLNGEADLTAAGFQFDFDAPGRGVARHVGQRRSRDEPGD